MEEILKGELKEYRKIRKKFQEKIIHLKIRLPAHQTDVTIL